jgi:hypothetical protein
VPVLGHPVSFTTLQVPPRADTCSSPVVVVRSGYITCFILHFISKFPKFQNSLLYLMWVYSRANTFSWDVHVAVESHRLHYADCQKSQSYSYFDNESDVRKKETEGTNKYIRFKCKRESSINLNTYTASFQFFPYLTVCVIRTHRVFKFQYGPYCSIKHALWKWI